QALRCASLAPHDIGYINLNGTATQLNDAMESLAVHQVFGEQVACGSTMALTGHTLGAAGDIDAAFLWLALNQEKNGRIPLPLHAWDGVRDMDLASIALVAPNQTASAMNGRFSLMSNSFAFGGSNVSIILGKSKKRDV